MTLPPASDTPEESTGGNAQNISGENVVGSVFAEGSAQVTINQIRNVPLSQVEEKRKRQQAELDALQKAIEDKYRHLTELVDTPAPAIGNPYLFLQPFGFKDRSRFFGRENEITELCQRVTHNTVTFLSGNSGTGKTSLLRAGLTPLLLKQQHLPLVISVGSERLDTRIKKELLPNIEENEFLAKMSLTEFIRIVTGALPAGKMLFVIVDDFEDYFNDQRHSETERNDFYNEWQRCFSGAVPNAHWLFCVPSNLQYLLNFFKREVQPNPNTVSVSPFERGAARAAILKPAESRGVHVEEQVVTSILDILGGTNIDPAGLQLICYMLAAGNGAIQKEWTMEYYVAQGQADGILRDYLDRTIEGLQPPEREPAWHVLAVLADPAMQTTTEAQLVDRLKLYDVEEQITHRVLVDLESSNLIERGPAFKLSSDSLRPRIEKWKETRSSRERARQETIQQLQTIRNSALRGLLGGVVGFIAFDYIINVRQSLDFSYDYFRIVLDGAIGALIGLLLVFSVDVAAATYRGPGKRLAYLGGAFGGALAFVLGLVTYSNLIYLGPTEFAAVIPRAILEGGIWGATAGMQTTWALRSRQPYWIAIPICILLCGLTLMLADLIFGVLRNRLPSATFLSLGMAGAALPAFILTAAIIGRRKFN